MSGRREEVVTIVTWSTFRAAYHQPSRRAVAVYPRAAKDAPEIARVLGGCVRGRHHHAKARMANRLV